MAQGIKNDLADITYYIVTTPVHFTTSNVPLAELNANMLILDEKLEGWIQSGVEAFSEAGNGTFTTGVSFTPAMNALPNISLTLDTPAGTGGETLFLETASRTVNGFNLTVKGVGTAGAWTANVMWIADGR